MIRSGYLTGTCLFQALMMPEVKCLFQNHSCRLLCFEIKLHWMNERVKYKSCQNFIFSLLYWVTTSLLITYANLWKYLWSKICIVLSSLLKCSDPLEQNINHVNKFVVNVPALVHSIISKHLKHIRKET